MRGLRPIAGLIAFLALLAAGPAQAAFPGRNGLLALDPPGGNGVVLASPNGHVERNLCPGPAIASPDVAGSDCRHISGASWSPDGRVLLLRQNGGVSLVYPDGSCLACAERTGNPITGAAFTRRDGLVLTEATSARQGIFAGAAYDEVIATAFEAIQLHLPPFVVPHDPAAGTVNETVFVARRHGQNWIARPPLALPGKRGGARHYAEQWLVRGSAPAFSPDGHLLAFGRGGWITLLTLRTHHSRRLVRGVAAAFSPDGRELAVVGRADTVSIVTLATGRMHLLGGLRATHVDWQPLVAGPPHCLLPPGSKVEASGPAGQVLVYFDGSSHLACLQTTQQTRLLATSFYHSQTGVSDFRFAGATIAYVLSQSPEEFSSCFPEQEYLVEVNLATAGSLSDYVQNGCHSGEGDLQLDSWVLAPSGAIAYIVSSGVEDSVSGAWTYGQSLIVHDSAGARRIDSANEATSGPPQPILTNLAVNGSTLTWDHAGQPRSAQLGGAP